MREILAHRAPTSPEYSNFPTNNTLPIAEMVPYQLPVVPEIIVAGNPLERLDQERKPQRPMVEYLRRQINTFSQQEIRLSVVTQMGSQDPQRWEHWRRPRRGGRRKRNNCDRDCTHFDCRRKEPYKQAFRRISLVKTVVFGKAA